MEPIRAGEGPEIVLSAQSSAAVAAVAAQSGQKTPQEAPKSATGRAQKPNARPRGPKGAARDPKLVPEGSQEAQKMKPESQHKRKSGNAKNLKKTQGKPRFFKDSGGVDPLQNEARGDQNQSLEAKRRKVGAKSSPSPQKIAKKNEKIEKPRGLGL